MSWLTTLFSKKSANKTPKLHNELTTMQLIRRYLITRLPKAKEAAIRREMSLIDSLPQNKVNHIAVILDDKVEEVIRAQNRLAALLLSEPTFVEFDPTKTPIALGITEYVNEEFVTPQPEGEHAHTSEATLGYEETNVFEEK